MKHYRGSIVEKCVYLTLLVVLVAADEEACDRTQCPGPLRYYKDLGCTPVYKNPSDCCAIEYNCDHLKLNSEDKCYVNGREYDIGEQLRDEDRNPCDIGCTCRKGSRGGAAFICAAVDCAFGPHQPGCYTKNSPSQCCPGQQVCPDKPEDRPTCEVDGQIYKDGEHFTPKSDPELSCYCMPGYKGENVEPFCKKPGHPYCDPQFHHPDYIRENCAPVYYSNQSPQTSCSVFSRCQNNNDTVIHNHDTSKSTPDESLEERTCQFGNMKMHIGDELNQATNYDSVCVKCVCEVPPVPTCQRLADNECDVTQHPDFSSF